MGNESKKKMPVYEFAVLEDDVTDRMRFGRFEIVKTKKGILYKNYTGYKVFVSPYITGFDGKAHEMSVYKWLDDLLSMHHLFKGHESEKLSVGTDFTKGDLLDMSMITTEANMSYPLLAFTDSDNAAKKAFEYMDWLSEQAVLLEKSELSPIMEEDERANAELAGKYKLWEEAKGLILPVTEEADDKK